MCSKRRAVQMFLFHERPHKLKSQAASLISFLVIAKENCIWADNVCTTLQPSVLTNCQVIAPPSRSDGDFAQKYWQAFKSSAVY